MPEDTPRLALIGRIAELAALAGFGRTPAQIYALLLMSEEPLSLDDMAGALGLSKASVSVSVRELAGHGAVRKVWGRATRRDLWEAEEILRVLRAWAGSGLTRRVGEIGAVLAEAEAYLDSGRGQKAPAGAHGASGSRASTGPDAGSVARRLAHARELHQKIATLLELLPALLEDGEAPGPGGAAPENER
jgi:DNA-binding MarR family transcriptional regulator